MREGEEVDVQERGRERGKGQCGWHISCWGELGQEKIFGLTEHGLFVSISFYRN